MRLNKILQLEITDILCEHICSIAKIFGGVFDTPETVRHLGHCGIGLAGSVRILLRNIGKCLDDCDDLISGFLELGCLMFDASNAFHGGIQLGDAATYRSRGIFDVAVLLVNNGACALHRINNRLGVRNQCIDNLCDIAACCIGLLRKFLNFGCNASKSAYGNTRARSFASCGERIQILSSSNIIDT